MPGNDVQVGKVDDKPASEPVEKKPFDRKAFWARIDALGDNPFPDVRDDDLKPDLDDDISFD